MKFSGQHIAVLGAGRSGLAAARLAAREGARVTLFDEGSPEALSKSMAAATAEGLGFVAGEEARTASIQPGDYHLVILSPGIDAQWPLPQKFVAAGVTLTGEMEFAFTLTDMPMIAITGTNGKSTTTELMSAVLNACDKSSIPCGNHGTALSEVILSGRRYDMLSLEVSSFQLETIRTFRPPISMWLNFAADHLDRYASEADYFAAKFRIFDNQTAEDHAIVNAQEIERLGTLRPNTLTFSSYVPADFEYRDGAFFHQGQLIGRADKLRLRGKHNMENVLATLAAGSILGLAFEPMLEAIMSYEPPKHRCELVREWRGIEFINDSKATNLHALESCIRSLETPLVLIMGGKEKGLDYSQLRASLPGKVRSLVTLGEIGGKLAEQFGSLLPCRKASDMAHAVQLAAEAAQSGDSVVLSPGTSSFDMYSGYAERGEAFRSAALNLH